MGSLTNAFAGLAGALGAVSLLAALPAAAKEAAEGGRSALEAALAEASQRESQGGPSEQFRDVVKQIDALQVYNAQMESLIASQEAELESIVRQMGRVDVVERSVTPLMLRMVEALEEFVDLDVPFDIEKRKKAVQDLKAAMNQADLSPADKYRRIIEAYQIENEYGRTIDAYRSTFTKDGKELTVDFLRFGRIALVYQSLDESQAGVWNQNTKSWDEVDSAYRSAIRQGLRIARKQAAPDLVRLPLPAAQPATGGES